MEELARMLISKRNIIVEITGFEPLLTIVFNTEGYKIAKLNDKDQTYFGINNGKTTFCGYIYTVNQTQEELMRVVER